MNSYERPGHVLHTPFGLHAIRILQLLLGIVLLGLAAWGISQYSTSGFDLTLFTAICTVIVIAYALISLRRPITYNYWAIVALDIFLIVFWLVSFAKTAAEANSLRIGLNYFDLDLGFFKKFRNILITCAVLGALEFILFIISLLTTLYFLSKHRDAGGHSIAHPMTRTGNVEMQPQQRPDPTFVPPTEYRNPGPPPLIPTTQTQQV